MDEVSATIRILASAHQRQGPVFLVVGDPLNKPFSDFGDQLGVVEAAQHLGTATRYPCDQRDFKPR
jgi:hypothetical protein